MVGEPLGRRQPRRVGTSAPQILSDHWRRTEEARTGRSRFVAGPGEPRVGILTAIFVALLGLLGAAFSKLLADEFKAWAPSLTSRILAVATRAMPPSRRARCAEEWEAHVSETPGD